MTDIAIWLLRWTIAGALLSTIVIVTAYVLDRSGRGAGLHLYRIALLTAVMAPLIALAPPVLTFSAAPSPAAQTHRPVASPDDPPEAWETPAPVARDRSGEGSGDVALDGLAIALIGVWIAGVAFGSIRRQRSAARFLRAFRSGAPYPTSFVECRLSVDAPAPLLFGILRPRMLAPADFPEWPSAEREAVLRHEAAHLRRGDLVWATLGDAVSVLYWWMPPVLALTRQHVLATEEACDSASLGGRDDRHGYARTLLAITRRVGKHTAPGLAATGPNMRRRIERLIAPQKGEFVALTAPVAATAAAACALLALSGPAAAQSESIRIYIFNAAGGWSDTYAFSDGNRVTAAIVENCIGRRSPTASAIVNQLEGRIRNGREDELNPVTIIGRGSRIELGSCDPRPARGEPDEDSLVLVVGASDNQARRLIRQIHSLPREDEREMLTDLGLSDRR